MYATAVNIVWYYSRTNGECIRYQRHAYRIAHLFEQQKMAGPYGHEIPRFHTKVLENDVEGAVANLTASASARKILVLVSNAWFAPVAADLAERYGSDMVVRSVFKPEEIEDLLV